MRAPEAVPLIVQTEQARHIENRLYPRGVEMDAAAGWLRTFCALTFRPGVGKLVRVPLIPPAAVCPTCVAVARRWFASTYFEPFDVVQRRRLLTVLGRDLEAVA